MKDIIDEIYEMKESVGYEIGEANKRIQNAGNKISTTDLDIIDKLTHTMKSLTTICAMLEEEEGGESQDYMQGDSYRGGYSGRNNRGRYDRNSYARGSRRNSYGYSRTGDMTERLRQMMDDAPDEQTRNEIRKLMDRFDR